MNQDIFAVPRDGGDLFPLYQSWHMGGQHETQIGAVIRDITNGATDQLRAQPTANRFNFGEFRHALGYKAMPDKVKKLEKR